MSDLFFDSIFRGRYPLYGKETRMPMTPEQIHNWFSYHAPEGDQLTRYAAVRDAGKHMALVLNDMCPDSADKTAAIRKVREAVMTANASIACDGK